MSNENPNIPKNAEEYKADYKKRLLEKANQKYKDFNKNKSDEKIEAKPTNIFQKAKTFVEAVASKGLSGKRCSDDTKKLRILSCHGDSELPPCSERKNSDKYADSFYCGACGCGDKKGTQLVNITIGGEIQYSKLDYPKVSCPLKMPGFTDYVESKTGVSENSRKKNIEQRYGVEYISEHSNPKGNS